MFRLSVVPLLFIGGAFAVNAQTVIATDLNAPVVYENFITDDAPVGQSFSTGSSGYNLASVTLILSNSSFSLDDARRAGAAAASPSMGHGVAVNSKSPRKMIASVSGCSSNCTQVFLYSDNGGPGPGTLLATSTTTELDSALPSTPQPVTFSFSGFTLSAHTRYWILVASSTFSVAEWYGTSSPAGTNLAGEYYQFGGNIVSDSGDTSAFLMSVSGSTSSVTPTPVPSSLMLALIGLLSAGTYVAWRKLRFS